MRGDILHVGCGSAELPEWITGYCETRLDIDGRHDPDIVADMIDLGEIGTFDAVYCSHALEHLFPHDGLKALQEFNRVLNDKGLAFITVPDLEGIEATEDILFESEAGPITGLDLIYGLRRVLPDNPYMAHKNGFTEKTLTEMMENAGFKIVIIKKMHPYNLLCVASK